MKHLEFLGWDDFFENHLSPTEKNDFVIARIIAEHKNAFIIKNDTGEHRAIISGRFFHNLEKRSDMPVVGDWVLIQKGTEDPAIIQDIAPRKTALSRRAPSNRKALDRKAFSGDKERVIASNIDTVFIVTSLNQNFNLSRIERALALVYTSGATPVILLSKSDLCNDTEQKINLVEQIAVGVPIIHFSNITGNGIAEIKQLIEPQRTICLLGSSGVGKTSLMNLLCSQAEKTLEIREKDGRGRHATTSRSLYVLENGGMIIDTPGIREIGMWDAGEDLGQSHADIEQLISSCRFTNCTHQNEPDCAVLAAIKNGSLNERRFRNYLKMQKENHFQNDKFDSRREKREKGKKIAKMIKEIKLS